MGEIHTYNVHCSAGGIHNTRYNLDIHVVEKKDNILLIILNPTHVLTMVSDVAPFCLREGVLPLSNPLLHTRGDGSTTIAIEWRVATQPARERGRR